MYTIRREEIKKLMSGTSCSYHDRMVDSGHGQCLYWMTRGADKGLAGKMRLHVEFRYHWNGNYPSF